AGLDAAAVAASPRLAAEQASAQAVLSVLAAPDAAPAAAYGDLERAMGSQNARLLVETAREARELPGARESLAALAERAADKPGRSPAEAARGLRLFFDNAAMGGGDGAVDVRVHHRGLAESFAASSPRRADGRLGRAMGTLRARSAADAARRAELEARLLYDTGELARAFRILRDAPGEPRALELARLYPEVAGLLRQPAERESYDMISAQGSSALFDHVVERALGEKLLGLERGNRSVFNEPGLSESAFREDAARLQRVASAGFLPHFRAAVLLHDTAKGDPEVFADQSARLDLDPAIANKASALVLRHKRYPFSRKEGVFAHLALPGRGAKRRILDELAYQLVAMRGLPGMFVRGEVTPHVFGPTLDWIRRERGALAEALTPGRPEELPGLLADLFYLFNAVDVAAVRPGLFKDGLRGSLRDVFSGFEAAIRDGKTAFGPEPAREAGEMRRQLFERFQALRRRRLSSGEDPSHLREALAGMPDGLVRELFRRMANFQGWFVENATAGLSAASQIKLIALSAVLAEAKGADAGRPFHVNFAPMMRSVAFSRAGYDSYIVRMMESMLRRASMEDILAGRGLEAFDRDGADGAGLGAVSMAVDGTKAIAFDFALSPMARGLVQLLHYFQARSQVLHQKILKDLLDLFGVRLDEFDRVHNEADYLKTMAAAKGDKGRMMEYVAPGAVLEVGPAGGAVLELLEEVRRHRGDVSRIIGVDISEEALKDLEARRKATGASYELVKGDAFELRRVMADKGVSALGTIIFCSILHEIYSYVPWEGRKFNLGSVKAMVGEALAALAPGGRMIIRDGVIADDGESFQVLEIKDKASMDFFKAYVDNFEGRKLEFSILSDETAAGGSARLRIKRKDAAAFMYTLTWGPESFPYEVREQYGILTRGAYLDLIREAAAERGLRVREVPVAPELRSYVQEGYVRNLQDKVALRTESGETAPFPPTNMIIVVERE
ncbi:MAG TPA: hypothetical protein VNI01_15565, partial [Elusimicrobiota bacterium]|nr:hypothetical protein [Elusimicrobiota bacterium]